MAQLVLFIGLISHAAVVAMAYDRNTHEGNTYYVRVRACETRSIKFRGKITTVNLGLLYTACKIVNATGDKTISLMLILVSLSTIIIKVHNNYSVKIKPSL